MRNRILGLVVVVSGCGTSAPAVEKGAFRFEDVVHDGEEALRVQVDRREIPLEDMPVASVLAGLPMTGLADLAIDLTVPKSAGKYDYRHATGSVAAACPTGCTLGDDTSPIVLADRTNLSFGHVTFDRLDVKVAVADGHLRITTWKLVSKDLSLDLRLDVTFAPELDASTLEGCVRFVAGPGLAKRDPKTAAVLLTTGAPVGPDGVSSITIGGTVGHRRMLGQVCN